MTKNNVSAWLKQSARQLSSLTSSPNLEAQLLLAQALHQPREWLLAHPDSCIPDQDLHSANEFLQRYRAGEPLPYILGCQEFFGLSFRVTPDVLIPRPETELLVERALAWGITHPSGHWVADVGTGSGCIAISLVLNNPVFQVLASDLSFSALQVAKSNLQKHQVADRIQLIQTNLLPITAFHFDLICANLPYIPSQILSELEVARNEPLTALDGGPDGLHLITSLLVQARQQVQPNGLLLLEIESSQGDTATTLAKSVFPRAQIQVMPDLAGHPRLLEIQLLE